MKCNLYWILAQPNPTFSLNFWSIHFVLAFSKSCESSHGKERIKFNRLLSATVTFFIIAVAVRSFSFPDRTATARRPAPVTMSRAGRSVRTNPDRRKNTGFASRIRCQCACGGIGNSSSNKYAGREAAKSQRSLSFRLHPRSALVCPGERITSGQPGAIWDL